MADFELPPELRQRFAERAERWEDLLQHHQQLLGQQVNDRAREWMADHMMAMALIADTNRAWARGDIETGNQLMEMAKPCMDRASQEFHITVRDPGRPDSQPARTRKQVFSISRPMVSPLF